MNNARELCNLFIEEDANVIVNADQTFMKFYPEEEVFITKKDTKRDGVKVKADTKAGFTEIVTVNLAISRIEDPFVAYNGTKLKDTKHPPVTLAYKYRKWRGSTPGHISSVRCFSKEALV